MSTTVNVRVDKSKLPQQLKDNSAATQQQAAQQAVDEAAAEQVRANNEALRRRQQDAVAKFRKSRHDPIGRRDGGELTLPNQLVDGQLTGPVVVQDGAAVRVARVGIRRNTSGTKIFVYPWGIEGALGGRLSNDYTTALSQAGGVGVELEVPVPSWWAVSQPAPSRPNPPHQYAFVPVAEGRRYGTSPMADISSFAANFYFQNDFGSGEYWWQEGRGTLNFDREFVSNTGYNISGFTRYYDDTSPGTNSYTLYYYKDIFISTTDFTPTPEELLDTQLFALPAGGDKCLVVLVSRALIDRRLIRLFYEYNGKETIYAQKSKRIATSVIYTGGYTGYESLTDIEAGYGVQCVLVDGARATLVPTSEELLAACQELLPPLDFDTATGAVSGRVQKSLRYGFGVTSEPIPKTIFLSGFNDYTRIPSPNDFTAGQFSSIPDITYGYEVPKEWPNPAYGNTTSFENVNFPALERSNISAGMYADQPENKQVVAKQLGIGYLETSDHSGKFFTPAIYEWLAGNAKLTTRYSEVAPAFYQPGDENNPFVGVYLSVTKGAEDAIEMRATATQPTDITTAHTVLDWVTINTASRYGDYLVWDWGNPEYCQQRLQALGMNV